MQLSYRLQIRILYNKEVCIYNNMNKCMYFTYVHKPGFLTPVDLMIDETNFQHQNF